MRSRKSESHRLATDLNLGKVRKSLTASEKHGIFAM